MLEPLASGLVRAHAVAIANDRVSIVTDEYKNAALNFIDKTLDLWKHEQADGDGNIEVQPIAVGLLGGTYPAGAGLMLGDIAASRTTKFIKADKLRPEECAGPFVRCTADLLVRLWGEKYAPVADAGNSIPLDVAMALLVQRDGGTMNAESLAIAVRLMWISTWSMLGVYENAVRQIDPELSAARERRAKQLAALKQAREVTAKRKAERARQLAADAKRMATDLFVRDISLTNDQVATRLMQFSDFRHLSHRGVRDRIKGAQTDAKTILARNPPKATGV